MAPLCWDSQKKSPSEGLGGLSLGLLIFETKTHLVTANITIEARIWFLRPFELRITKGIALPALVIASSP
jgi:hypothetical protein